MLIAVACKLGLFLMCLGRNTMGKERKERNGRLSMYLSHIVHMI